MVFLSNWPVDPVEHTRVAINFVANGIVHLFCGIPEWGLRPDTRTAYPKGLSIDDNQGAMTSGAHGMRDIGRYQEQFASAHGDDLAVDVQVHLAVQY